MGITWDRAWSLHLADCRENFPKHFEENWYFNTGQTKTETRNGCNHNLVSTTYKVSDCHLHHEWQWLAAVTTHWLHWLPTAGVDKYILLSSKCQAEICMKICVKSFCLISRSSTKAVMMLASMIINQHWWIEVQCQLVKESKFSAQISPGFWQDFAMS